jgi:hypothetical protein
MVTIYRFVDGITIQGEYKGECALTESEQKDVLLWFKRNLSTLWNEIEVGVENGRYSR